MDLTFEEVNKKKLSQILELNLSNKKLNAYIQILLQYVKTKI